ncbi:MAG: S8 family peptidase [Deinococcus sp.]
MRRLPALALLTSLLLAACGDPGSGTPARSHSVSGNVLLPGAAALTLGLNVPSAPNWAAPHVPGEVLVSSDARPGAVTQADADARFSGLKVQSLGVGGLQRVSTPAGESDQAFAARLAATGLSVQPNYLYKALDATPNDPGYPDPNHTGISIGGTSYDQSYLSRINALGGWQALMNAGKQPLGAVTAVLDTGVDTGHPELQGRLLPGYNAVDGSNDVSEATGGEVGHGTASAGLIGAATNNSRGLAALVWSGRTLLPIKVFENSGTASSAALAAGLDYAASHGAKVANMSLGLLGTTTDPALSQAIARAAAADVLLVASAGNTAGDGIYYPASDPNVLAVGAIGGTDPKSPGYNDLACYSARPKSGQKPLDLVAPGGNAGTGTSNCLSYSDYDLLVLAPRTLSGNRSEGGYALRAGTSEAAPLVSGAAALLRAYRPDLLAAPVHSALVNRARTVSGGKLLAVGAAVTRVGNVASVLRKYTLSVQAFRNGKLIATFPDSGTLTAGQNSVPYTFSGLPAGSVGLKASRSVNGVTSSGQITVQVTDDLGGQDIATK